MIKKLFIVPAVFAALIIPAVRVHTVAAAASANWPLVDPKAPARLIVPAIGLNVSVANVGLTAGGAMDVPPGTSKSVGWYKYGTMPGNVGSAVFDAHVFAVFSRLKYVKPGTDVYVLRNDNTLLHFVVQATETKTLASISTDKLFNRADTARLNLITCAGTYISRLGTYDHRFIAYAVLQEQAAFVGSGGAA